MSANITGEFVTTETLITMSRTMEKTCNLRFVRHPEVSLDGGPTRMRMILQQMSYCRHDGTQEWNDVPIDGDPTP